MIARYVSSWIPVSYQSLSRAATRHPSFIRDRNLISPVHKAGSLQWERQEKWPIRSGKILLCTSPKQIAWTKKTISCLSWLMTLSVQRETKRAGVGARAATLHWVGVEVAGVQGGCPRITGSCIVGAPRAGSPHGKRGQEPKSYEPRLHLHQTKPQISAWLCHLPNERFWESYFNSFRLSCLVSEMGVITGYIAQGHCVDW